MPAITDGEFLQQPKNPNTKIWRYMDFAKYVSMLQHESLYFTRSDLFEDKHEGLTNQGTFDYIKNDITRETGVDFSKYIPYSDKYLKKFHYINSWHMNNQESYAMWKIYGTRVEAVAIQSEYSLLAKHLPQDMHIWLGLIKYTDQDEINPTNKTYSNFMFKRKPFTFEQEVRAIFLKCADTSCSQKDMEKLVNMQKEGYHINISLTELIKTIYISPFAPDWFDELVKSVTNKYGFDFPIIKSDLLKDPVY